MDNASRFPKKRRNERQGQSTVEYILIIAVIVVFSGVAYSSIKTYLVKPLSKVKSDFEGNGTKPSAGSGAKKTDAYYRDVEFKAK